MSNQTYNDAVKTLNFASAIITGNEQVALLDTLQAWARKKEQERAVWQRCWPTKCPLSDFYSEQFGKPVGVTTTQVYSDATFILKLPPALERVVFLVDENGDMRGIINATQFGDIVAQVRAEVEAWQHGRV